MISILISIFIRHDLVSIECRLQNANRYSKHMHISNSVTGDCIFLNAYFERKKQIKVDPQRKFEMKISFWKKEVLGV